MHAGDGRGLGRSGGGVPSAGTGEFDEGAARPVHRPPAAAASTMGWLTSGSTGGSARVPGGTGAPAGTRATPRPRATNAATSSGPLPAWRGSTHGLLRAGRRARRGGPRCWAAGSRGKDRRAGARRQGASGGVPPGLRERLAYFRLRHAARPLRVQLLAQGHGNLVARPMRAVLDCGAGNRMDEEPRGACKR
jgi:hypothetical protein